MAKRKPDEPKKGAPEWQCTFSDLMNLLLCFFVLLFSMSSVDANKWEEVVASMSSAFSIFNDGSTAIGEGTLVGTGTTQLSSLDEYYSSFGQTSEDNGDDAKQTDSGNVEGSEDGPELGDETGAQTGEQTGADADDNHGREGAEQGENAGDNYDSSHDQEGDAADRDKATEQGNESGETGATEGDQADKDKDKDKATEQGAESGEIGSESGEKSGEKTDRADNESQSLTLEQQLMIAGRAETEEMLDDISAMIDRLGVADSLELSMDSFGRYVEITISGSILFDSNSADLKSGSLPLLSKVGDIIKLYPGHSINVVGHTDNLPVKSGKYSSNEMLSSARAISAALYLVEKKGIDIKMISWTGRGEYEPIASNATAAGRALNRRVEVRIYNSLSSD